MPHLEDLAGVDNSPPPFRLQLIDASPAQKKPESRFDPRQSLILKHAALERF